VFRALPYSVRRLLTFKHLGPSGGTALHGRVEGLVPILAGWHIDASEVLSGADGHGPQLKLTLRNDAGEVIEHITDHLIAGTGFRYDLKRLRFLTGDLLARLARWPTGAPQLSRNFESCVRGVYFVGPVASTSFGPLLRFAAGAQYAATRVTSHLAANLGQIQPRTEAARSEASREKTFQRPGHATQESRH
jgi:hypothetical protein